MGRPRSRAYKRTWKNLLINKRYQLRFTLFMVGLSAALMSLLGWWVMAEAGSATTTAVNNALTACRDLPGAPLGATGATAAVRPPPTPPAAKPRTRPRPVVTIDDSGMPAAEAPPPAAEPRRPSSAQIAAYERCEAGVPGTVRQLEGRLRLTFWLLLGAGVVICVALLLYGIKMTHKVAGPLHKITLYMSKLRQGHYDVVYNLRRGDHLMEFYEHFKAAHAGMRTLQEEDVARLRALLAAASEARLTTRSTDLAEAVIELRALLDDKEKSLA
jgi:hypothetical protein